MIDFDLFYLYRKGLFQMAHLRALPTTPLLSERKRNDDVRIDVDIPEYKVLASHGLLTNIAQFLDVGSVANFVFTTKNTSQLFNKIQPEKHDLLKQIMKHQEKIEQIDLCETAIRAELNSTWIYKTAGHLSWFLPIGGSYAGIGLAMYKLQELAASERVPDDGYPGSEYDAATIVIGIASCLSLIGCVGTRLPQKIYNATFNRLDPMNKVYVNVLSAETAQKVADVEIKQVNPTLKVLLADLNQTRQVELKNRVEKFTQLGTAFFMKNSVADEKTGITECLVQQNFSFSKKHAQ